MHSGPVLCDVCRPVGRDRRQADFWDSKRWSGPEKTGATRKNRLVLDEEGSWGLSVPWW